MVAGATSDQDAGAEFMNQFATYPSLRDKVVLVTGGGSGIGASLVEQFAHQGAKVAFIDTAVNASIEVVKTLSTHCAHPPRYLPCDLTDIVALQEAIGLLSSELGSPDVLVNNAGSDDRHTFQEVTPDLWDERIAVNLRHQFFAAQAVAPGMKLKGSGSIINMSSIAWMIPSPQLAVYVTAKAAIVGMTRALAHELGPSNIRVNCVLPGAILTERQRKLWMSAEYEAEVLSRQSLKRHLMPEEVARLILFLAADDSAGITNQNHIIDGGWI
jgi:NAD(P)-dependent dehydrogenase (short-subunit alcohol dehydrogenase family)